MPSDGVTNSDGAGDRPRAARRVPRHVLYYLLAGFDVLTVCAALYLSQHSLDVSLRSVARYREWARHADEFASLQRLAAEVNAPGNEVFASEQVGPQSRRLQAAQGALLGTLQALRGHMAAAHPEQAPALLAQLEAVQQTATAMATEAEATLAGVAAGATGEAGRRMARMDRRYAEVLSSLEGLRRAVTLIQSDLLARQTADLRRLRRYAFVIVGLVVLMVAAAIVYGTRVEREIRAEAEERERSVRDLHEAERQLRRAQTDLEARVEERTRALRASEGALRQAASEWRRTFDAIDTPLLVLDGERRLVRANAAARSFTPEPVEGVTGRIVDSLARAEPWVTAARLADAARAAQAPASGQAGDAEGGRSWDVTAYPVPAAEGEQARTILVTRDTTRELELQERLRREETMAAMGRLVAGVAHEVRNPIFAISSTLDGLENRFGTTPGLEKYFPVLRREVTRLGHLARELLEYARPPRLEASRVRLEAVISEAARTCGAEAAAGGVAIDAGVGPELPELTADQHRLVQVFHNVLHNAVLHTPPGGRVRIEAELIQAAGRPWIECRVLDGGPGFRPEDLPRVFEPLFTRRTGGTGLGLAIAHRIVQMHGGSMRAGNRAEGGAEVAVRLPVGGASSGREVEAQTVG